MSLLKTFILGLFVFCFFGLMSELSAQGPITSFCAGVVRLLKRPPLFTDEEIRFIDQLNETIQHGTPFELATFVVDHQEEITALRRRLDDFPRNLPRELIEFSKGLNVLRYRVVGPDDMDPSEESQFVRAGMILYRDP